MKKVLYIFLIFLWGCTKVELPLPEVIAKDDIFSVSESSVTNGQSLHFNLPSAGVYILTLIDAESGQVISREKFVGQNGENVKKIYTKSIVSKYLYLILSSDDKTQISKTKLKLN